MTGRQRFRILARDNFNCRYCGRRAPELTSPAPLEGWKQQKVFECSRHTVCAGVGRSGRGRGGEV